MFKKIIFICLFLFLIFGGLGATYGQGLVPSDRRGDCPDNYSGNCGDYQLNDFVALAINIAKWILGIVGSLCLLMIIYGGFMMIISGENVVSEGGKSTKINKGKKTITAALIGLIIVFASYLIIKFVLAAFGLNWQGTTTPLTRAEFLPQLKPFLAALKRL